VFSRRKLSQGDLEVVCIVKGVEKIFMKGMDILKSRKSIKDCCNLLGKGFGSVFDLSDIKGWKSKMSITNILLPHYT